MIKWTKAHKYVCLTVVSQCFNSPEDLCRLNPSTPLLSLLFLLNSAVRRKSRTSLRGFIRRLDLLRRCLPVRKMPRSVRPGADDSLGKVRCRLLHAPLLWIGAEQEWHLGDKNWMKELPLELRHASSSEIIGVINIPLPAEQVQLLQPG